jgi:hypothetical protein
VEVKLLSWSKRTRKSTFIKAVDEFEYKVRATFKWVILPKSNRIFRWRITLFQTWRMQLQIRTVKGAICWVHFLFGDDVEKKVKVLSGEKETVWHCVSCCCSPLMFY